MDASNLSIVFGPTLMFPDPRRMSMTSHNMTMSHNMMTSHNMSVQTVYQSRVVELLLVEYENVFDDSFPNKSYHHNEML